MSRRPTLDMRLAAMLDDDELVDELQAVWLENRRDRARMDSFWLALLGEAAARWFREQCREQAKRAA